MPISVSACPSKPPEPSSRPSPPRLSIQATSAAKLAAMPRSAIACSENSVRGLSRRGCVTRSGSRRRGHRTAPARDLIAARPAAPMSGAIADERLLAADDDVDLPVRVDPHRHVGIDQPEAFDARACRSESSCRTCRRRPWARPRPKRPRRRAARCREAQRGAALCVALEQRAADLDAIAVAEILLDRGGEPGRREIEQDRPAGEPPPQRAAADQQHRDQRAPTAIVSLRTTGCLRSNRNQRIERQPPAGLAQAASQPARLRFAGARTAQRRHAARRAGCVCARRCCIAAPLPIPGAPRCADCYSCPSCPIGRPLVRRS